MGTGRGSPCLSFSFLVWVLASPQVAAGSQGRVRRDRFRDVEIDSVEIDFGPFLSAVQSNFKNIPLDIEQRYFVYYLVRASLLKAVKRLYKASFELEGNPKPLRPPCALRFFRQGD